MKVHKSRRVTAHHLTEGQMAAIAGCRMMDVMGGSSSLRRLPGAYLQWSDVMFREYHLQRGKHESSISLIRPLLLRRFEIRPDSNFDGNSGRVVISLVWTHWRQICQQNHCKKFRGKACSVCMANDWVIYYLFVPRGKPTVERTDGLRIEWRILVCEGRGEYLWYRCWTRSVER